MIKVLGVADPAVLTYNDRETMIISTWSEKSGTDVEFIILPWNDYFPILMDTLTGKRNDFHIVMIAGHLWLRDFINRGFLQPLEGIKKAVNTYGPYDDILPGIREEIEVDGIPWLIPSFTDGHIIFYKKREITETIGGELPEIIRPSEYCSIIHRIAGHKRGKDRQFLAMKAHPSEIFLDWLPFFYETGDDLFDPDLKPCFNTPEAVESLARYIELKHYAVPGVENAGNEQVLKALQSEDCFIGTSWGGQAGFIVEEHMLREDSMGFSTYTIPWNVSWSFGIPSGAPYDDVQQDFLAYLVSPGVDRIVGEKAGSPVRSSSYDAGQVSLPWMSVQHRMVSLSKRLPGFTRSGDIYGFFYKWIFTAFSGEISPSRAMDELEREVIREMNTEK